MDKGSQSIFDLLYYIQFTKLVIAYMNIHKLFTIDNSNSLNNEENELSILWTQSILGTRRLYTEDTTLFYDINFIF